MRTRVDSALDRSKTRATGLIERPFDVQKKQTTIAHNFATVGELMARRRGLHAAEREVLRLLKRKAA